MAYSGDAPESGIGLVLSLNQWHKLYGLLHDDLKRAEAEQKESDLPDYFDPGIAFVQRLLNALTEARLAGETNVEGRATILARRAFNDEFDGSQRWDKADPMTRAAWLGMARAFVRLGLDQEEPARPETKGQLRLAGMGIDYEVPATLGADGFIRIDHAGAGDPAAVAEEVAATIRAAGPQPVIRRGPVWRGSAFICHVHETLPDAAYIGRALPKLNLPGSPLANPWKITKQQSRGAVLEKYENWLHREIERGAPEVIAALIAVRNRPLACWCRRSGEDFPPCHGDIILAVLEAMDDAELRAKVAG